MDGAVAFTGEPAREQANLALTLLKYLTFLPVIVWLPVAIGPWIGATPLHFVSAAVVLAAAHFSLRALHRRIINEHCNMPGLEDETVYHKSIDNLTTELAKLFIPHPPEPDQSPSRDTLQ